MHPAGAADSILADRGFHTMMAAVRARSLGHPAARGLRVGEPKSDGNDDYYDYYQDFYYYYYHYTRTLPTTYYLLPTTY